MKVLRKFVSAIVLVLFLSAAAFAQGLPVADSPEEVGMSSERLARLTSGLKAAVEKGTIPGAVGIIVRKGKVAYFEAIGFQDRENKVPMAKESIFRIYSMSKVFTSLAIMMLVEEGKIILADPVSKFLPEFKDMKVGVKKKNHYADTKEL